MKLIISQLTSLGRLFLMIRLTVMKWSIFVYIEVRRGDLKMGKDGSRSRRFGFTFCDVRSIMSLTVASKGEKNKTSLLKAKKLL